MCSNIEVCSVIGKSVVYGILCMLYHWQLLALADARMFGCLQAGKEEKDRDSGDNMSLTTFSLHCTNRIVD